MVWLLVVVVVCFGAFGIVFVVLVAVPPFSFGLTSGIRTPIVTFYSHYANLRMTGAQRPFGTSASKG